MATGFLNRHGVPCIEISLYGNAIPAVIDTGFEGGLQLPLSWLEILNPSRHSHATYQMPTGEQREADTYTVPITVDGLEIDADTIFFESNEILICTETLNRFRLIVDFPAGAVLLERVAPTS